MFTQINKNLLFSAKSPLIRNVRRPHKLLDIWIAHAKKHFR